MLIETMKPSNGKDSVDSSYSGVTVNSTGNETSSTGSSSAVLAPLAQVGTQGTTVGSESQTTRETGDKTDETAGGIGSCGVLNSIVQGMVRESMNTNNETAGEVLSPYLVLGSLTDVKNKN